RSAAGFAALAPDLYGDGRTASTIDEAQALIATINGSRTNATLGAAIDLLHAHPAVIGSSLGAVGLSMGASWAMYLSTQRPDHVAAVVVFYGSEEADYTVAHAGHQGHFAEDEEGERADGVKKVQDVIAAAGRDVTFYTYPGTKHWFAEPDRPDAYDPAAADLAWD